MQLLIFGASGATGQHLVRLALAQGHAVTAFVRDPARLPANGERRTANGERRTANGERLRCIVGDVMLLPSVEAALAGQDAVLCALGTMPEARADRSRQQPAVPVCSVGTGNILAAMSRHACRRIVVESSISVGESRHRGRLGAALVVRTLLRKVMNDKELQESAVRASSTDWTIVRPVKMTNGPAKGHFQTGVNLRWNLLSSVPRADVAAFMLAALGDPAASRQVLTIKS
jgi:uncharacterized protein YbjT (DUF2867 family)